VSFWPLHTYKFALALNLIQDLYLENVAGVYGRQEPLAFSSDIDKRDLLIVFGLDKKIQLKDPFFHNANSAFLRETWEKFPFDEVVTNIEDRVWGQSVIDSGMKIIYEPEASVYHWHGIHQDLNLSRARNIVRIIEETQNIQNSIFYDNENQEVVALIPIRGESLMARNQTLLRYTIDAAKASRLITRIVVSTDNANTANLAKALGAEVPFIRPHNLSEEYVDIAQVLQYSLIELERKSKTPDLVVLLEEAYPFRRAEILDLMIDRFNEEGLDSLIAVIPESRAILKRADDKIEVVDDGFMPRKMKQYHAMVGLLGFATVVHPSVLRKGDLFGKNIGVYEIEDIFSSLEVSNESLFIKALGYLDKQ